MELREFKEFEEFSKFPKFPKFLKFLLKKKRKQTLIMSNLQSCYYFPRTSCELSADKSKCLFLKLVDSFLIIFLH